MIKKKIFAGLASAAMVVSMFPMTAFASSPAWNANGGETTMEGSGVAAPVVVEVALPENLAFVLNPYSLDFDEDGTRDPQIWTQEYAITNLGPIPVNIEIATKATVAADVTLASAPTFDTQTKNEMLPATAGKREVFLYQIFPNAVTFAEATGWDYTYAADADLVAASDKINNAASGKLKNALVLTAADQKLNFQLAGVEAEAAKETAHYEKCSVAFKLGGALAADTEVPYAENDVTITVTYTMKHLTENMYASYDTQDTSLLTNAAYNMKRN